VAARASNAAAAAHRSFDGVVMTHHVFRLLRRPPKPSTQMAGNVRVWRRLPRSPRRQSRRGSEAAEQTAESANTGQGVGRCRLGSQVRWKGSAEVEVAAAGRLDRRRGLSSGRSERRFVRVASGRRGPTATWKRQNSVADFQDLSAAARDLLRDARGARWLRENAIF
jgi:hypothetical protein